MKRKPTPHGSGSHLKELREEAANNPGSAEAQLSLGTALLKVGLVTKAERSLLRAVELDPGSAKAWSALGGARMSRWDFTGCVEANRRALECDPYSVLAHYNLGLGHLYRGDVKEVVSCFQRVVELDPQNAGGHYHLAVGLFADGQFEAARLTLSKAMTLGYTPEPELLRALEGPYGPAAATTIEIGSDSEDSKTTLQKGEGG